MALKNNQKNAKKTRILIVDDHPIVRDGLAGIINNEPDMTVCGEAEDTPGALKELRKLKPDMLLIDITLKDSSGLELVKSVKAQNPKLPMLVLSMHNESLYAERALRAGAKGYVMKHEAPKKVITAIRQILLGRIFVSDNISSKIMRKLAMGQAEDASSPLDCLSDRELEVFRMIGQGYGTRQIAEKLYLSVKTIETYRMHIREKLNIGQPNQLLRYAIKWANV